MKYYFINWNDNKSNLLSNSLIFIMSFYDFLQSLRASDEKARNDMLENLALQIDPDDENERIMFAVLLSCCFESSLQMECVIIDSKSLQIEITGYAAGTGGWTEITLEFVLEKEEYLLLFSEIINSLRSYAVTSISIAKLLSTEHQIQYSEYAEPIKESEDGDIFDDRDIINVHYKYLFGWFCNSKLLCTSYIEEDFHKIKNKNFPKSSINFARKDLVK